MLTTVAEWGGVENRIFSNLGKKISTVKKKKKEKRKKGKRL